MLSRKPEAKYAKHKFLEDRNDIIFFIEDTDKASKKVFKEILSKIFKGDKRISDIFPLGGRREVVSRCRKSKDLNKIEKAIYIIDGDLYLLTGENREIFGDFSDLDNLHVLSRYCIENYLIDEESIVHLLDEEDFVKDIEQVIEDFNYNEWLEKNEILFKEMYINYAIAHKISSGIPTISTNITKLVSSGKGELDANKVNNHLKLIKESIINTIGVNNYDELRTIIENSINKEDKFTLQYVSGKDHLFPLILARMKQVTKLKCENSTYKVRLAKKVEPREFIKIVELVDKLYA